MRHPGRPRVWKTADGTKIPITRMSTSHIINTICYLERCTKKNYCLELDAAESFMDSLNGDAAIYSMECEINRLCRMSWQDCLPEIYHSLQEELEHRKQMLEQI